MYLVQSRLAETLLPVANEPLSGPCQGNGCFWILSAAQRSTSHSPIRNKPWTADFWPCRNKAHRSSRGRSLFSETLWRLGIPELLSHQSQYKCGQPHKSRHPVL